MDLWTNVWVILGGVLLGLTLAAFATRKRWGPQAARLMGEAYQQRMLKKLRKSYPLLAARFEEFDVRPERQEALQAAMRRLPPQEGLKLQTEFMRLKENFLARHPEIGELISGAADPRGQAKAFEKAMKLPNDQRQAIEKDLLWAWDQLRGRFPRLMGPLEASVRKRAEGDARPAEPAKV
ncbi:MAG: hypothetical protein VKP62_16845 [Candidatus Sericytochromatia bacterium]|nr:hypothetical protein [Candidatus Sericytochromatia bacterium]